mmetsp:Transcript_7443/g.21164  ORF Transcript_7443/g.21164 Transcript_7443/m.21164 type:complete len:221 (-) Transcript_7443:286-948(-)
MPLQRKLHEHNRRAHRQWQLGKDTPLPAEHPVAATGRLRVRSEDLLDGRREEVRYDSDGDDEAHHPSVQHGGAGPLLRAPAQEAQDEEGNGHRAQPGDGVGVVGLRPRLRPLQGSRRLLGELGDPLLQDLVAGHGARLVPDAGTGHRLHRLEVVRVRVAAIRIGAVHDAHLAEFRRLGRRPLPLGGGHVVRWVRHDADPGGSPGGGLVEVVAQVPRHRSA